MITVKNLYVVTSQSVVCAILYLSCMSLVSIIVFDATSGLNQRWYARRVSRCFVFQLTFCDWLGCKRKRVLALPEAVFLDHQTCKGPNN
jgi:hypothetical protein